MLGRVVWSHDECNLGVERAPSAQNLNSEAIGSNPPFASLKFFYASACASISLLLLCDNDSSWATLSVPLSHFQNYLVQKAVSSSRNFTEIGGCISHFKNWKFEPFLLKCSLVYPAVVFYWRPHMYHSAFHHHVSFSLCPDAFLILFYFLFCSLTETESKFSDVLMQTSLTTFLIALTPVQSHSSQNSFVS